MRCALATVVVLSACAGRTAAPAYLSYEPRRILRGSVVDECGQPQKWASVRAENKWVYTDEKGEFVLDRVLVGDVELDVSGKYGDTHRVKQTASGEGPVRVVLPSVPHFTGRAVDALGEPIARFLIDDDTVITADGRFTVHEGVSQPFELTALDTETIVVDPERAKPGACGALELGDLTLGSGRLVTGSVVDAATGTPVEGARVQLPSEALRRRYYRGVRCGTCADGELVIERPLSDADGGFAFPHLARRSSTLTITKEGYLPEDWDVARPVVRLRRGATVAGRVLSVDGGGVEGAKVVLVDEDAPDFHFRDRNHLAGAPRYRAQAVDGGTFEISGLGGGEYGVSIRTEAVPETLYAARLAVHAGQRLSYDFVPRSGGVSVRVQPPKGEAGMKWAGLLPGVVTLRSREDLRGLSERAIRAERTGDDVTFLAVPAGVHTVVFSTRRSTEIIVVSQPIEVGSVNRELDLAGAATLTFPIADR